MIYPEYCYKKLGSSKVLCEYFKQSRGSLEYKDYFGFKVSDVPLEVILEEPILNSIHQNYKIKSGGIIKIEPYRSYNWHQDALRGVSVNLLLEHKDSFVLFGNSSSDSEDQFDIIRFNYEVGMLYLFNNQAMHSVVNFDEPRYLFTIEFELQKNELTYNELLNSL